MPRSRSTAIQSERARLLREYIAVMTRPQTWGKALTLAEAAADAAAFVRRFSVLEDGTPVWDHLMDLSAAAPSEGVRSMMPMSWRPCWRMASAGC
jgi:hypothetical protein